MLTSPASTLARLRSPSDRRLAGAPPRPDPPRSLDPCGIIPPLPCLWVWGARSPCFASPLLFLFPFPPLLPPCSPLRPPPWFFLLVVEVRGAVVWVGQNPSKPTPFLNPPTPPRLRSRHPGEGRHRLLPVKPHAAPPQRPVPHSRGVHVAPPRDPTAAGACPGLLQRKRCPRARDTCRRSAPSVGGADAPAAPSDPTVALDSLVTTNARSDPC